MTQRAPYALPHAPSVLVGIATHNRADELEKAIASVLTQSYRPLHIAVVDDASGDDTPSLRARYPRIDWQRWPHAQGYLRARNHMMLKASEDYYASLDDDAWFWAGDELALAISFLESHPRVAAVAFDILSPERPDPAPRGPARPAAMFIGCGHVLRLSAVQRLAGYAEVPGRYGGEEKDLCLRLVDAGFGIVKLDGVHVWHDKTMRARDLTRQHRSGVCNDLVFELRRCPLALLLPMLVWKLARHLAFALRHRLLRPCWRGFGDFFGALGDAWRGREPVRLASYARFLALIRDGRTEAALV